MSAAQNARMLARDAPKNSRKVLIVIMFESTSPDMRGGGPCVGPLRSPVVNDHVIRPAESPTLYDRVEVLLAVQTEVIIGVLMVACVRGTSLNEA